MGTHYLPTHNIYNQRSIVGYKNSVKLKIVCILKTSNEGKEVGISEGHDKV